VGRIIVGGIDLQIPAHGGYAWVGLRAVELSALLDELAALRADTKNPTARCLDRTVGFGPRRWSRGVPYIGHITTVLMR
jgi:hypothetical protein